MGGAVEAQEIGRCIGEVDKTDMAAREQGHAGQRIVA